jgi:phospholipid/cholesterol/gamma-HCH transport system substrate-binding protein
MNKTSESLEPGAGERNQTEERFKFRRVNEITGVFVLVIIALLVAAVLWMGHSQRWFRSRVTLRIVLPEAGAAGIRQGSEVYFLGTLVGSVSDVIVDTTGRMEAETNIRRDFFRFVRADSSAVVKKKFGVAGDAFFEITRGQGQPLPEAKASIVCNDQFQSPLETAVDDVRREAVLVLRKTSAGLDTWAKLGEELRETREHVDQLTVRVDKMATAVEAGQGTVGQLITDTSLVDDAHKILAKADLSMNQLQGVATNLNLAAADLPGVTGALAGEARDLPGLVQQTQTDLRELERLIEAMQKNWLVRKYVNKTNPPAAQPAFEERREPVYKPIFPPSKISNPSRLQRQ